MSTETPAEKMIIRFYAMAKDPRLYPLVDDAVYEALALDKKLTQGNTPNIALAVRDMFKADPKQTMYLLDLAEGRLKKGLKRFLQPTRKGQVPLDHRIQVKPSRSLKTTRVSTSRAKRGPKRD